MTSDTLTPLDYTSAAFAWSTSNVIDELAASLVAALGELDDVPRGRQARIESQRGASYQYRYADLADVLALTRPILAKHSLAVFQVPITYPDAVEVTTIVLHASGQWLQFAALRLPAGGTAQTFGSAITYARRYSVMAALGLATDDDDGAAASRTTATPPVLMAQSLLDLFRQRTAEHGLGADDVATIVRTATSGRTDDVEQVWQDEVDALSAALRSHFEAGQSGTASDDRPPAVAGAVPDTGGAGES